MLCNCDPSLPDAGAERPPKSEASRPSSSRTFAFAFKSRFKSPIIYNTLEWQETAAVQLGARLREVGDHLREVGPSEGLRDVEAPQGVSVDLHRERVDAYLRLHGEQE